MCRSSTAVSTLIACPLPLQVTRDASRCCTTANARHIIAEPFPWYHLLAASPGCNTFTTRPWAFQYLMPAQVMSGLSIVTASPAIVKAFSTTIPVHTFTQQMQSLGNCSFSGSALRRRIMWWPKCCTERNMTTKDTAAVSPVQAAEAHSPCSTTCNRCTTCSYTFVFAAVPVLLRAASGCGPVC